ncbi:hypothetical protein IGI42_001760 [Enterococcus sp. AZ109]
MLFLGMFISLTVNTPVLADTNQTELTLIIEKEELPKQIEVNKNVVLPKLSEHSNGNFLQIGVAVCLLACIGFTFQRILKYKEDQC